ncbi:hypothetical protein [Herbaspirillum chlorophenolicum]|uniref:hypothetical protein n=1 Tax=Herbaspirillum chlorophenolicum TaxID=211589 RepID=UPI001E5C53B5|nr:hypothetical protein [Herbaspirillum chlorophenolicum]
MNASDASPSPSPGAVLSMPIDPATRDLIDAALNTVMESAAADASLSMGTLGRCADYALVGARVLSLLLNRPYVAVSGGEIIDCGDGLYVVLFPSRDARRRARKLSDLKDYHCWIEALHSMPDGSHRLESIDFTARHDRLVADMFDIPYTRQDGRDYLWEWHDRIPEVPMQARHQLAANGRNGDWMWTDKNCLRLLRLYEEEHDSLLNTLAGKVLHALADAMQARATAIPVAAAGSSKPQWAEIG